MATFMPTRSKGGIKESGTKKKVETAAVIYALPDAASDNLTDSCQKT